jgi:predicted DNA-binding transcriptional regulator AlpA
MSTTLTVEPESEQLMKGPAVARYLDVDPATIRRYAREGMPHHILGPGLIRYKLSEVLAWRAQRKARLR